MPEETVFESERRETRGAVAAYLRDVADRIEAGELTLRAGTRETTLSLPEHVTFEVKVERELDAAGSVRERSVEFELEWDEGESDDSGPLSVE